MGLAIDVIDVVLMLAPLLEGHAETHGFSTVFGGPQEAACWHVCSAWGIRDLAGNLIAHRLIWALLVEQPGEAGGIMTGFRVFPGRFVQSFPCHPQRRTAFLPPTCAA